MAIKLVSAASPHTIAGALLKRNIPQFMLSEEDSLLQIGMGVQQERLRYDNINGALATYICQNKAITKDLLTDLSFLVPRGERVSNLDELQEAFNHLKKPLVVKPVSEMWGKGISSGIQSIDEAEEAYKIASAYSGDYVIVEEHIEGDDHRILILNGEHIASLKRGCPFVIGDGTQTVSNLVTEENEKRKKSSAIVKEIFIDETFEACLRAQGYTPDSIPKRGEKIFARMTGNICSGGISENVTNRVHSSIIKMAKDIGAFLKMDILGMDVITTDITQPLHKSGGRITEINENPDLSMHAAPYIGDAINTPLLFVDYLYKNPKDAWITITHNGSRIEKIPDLRHHLETIPQKVIQRGPDGANTAINSPERELLFYLLDVRTLSIEI